MAGLNSVMAVMRVAQRLQFLGALARAARKQGGQELVNKVLEAELREMASQPGGLVKEVGQLASLRALGRASADGGAEMLGVARAKPGAAGTKFQEDVRGLLVGEKRGRGKSDRKEIAREQERLRRSLEAPTVKEQLDSLPFPQGARDRDLYEKQLVEDLAADDSVGLEVKGPAPLPGEVDQRWVVRDPSALEVDQRMRGMMRESDYDALREAGEGSSYSPLNRLHKLTRDRMLEREKGLLREDVESAVRLKGDLTHWRNRDFRKYLVDQGVDQETGKVIRAELDPSDLAKRGLTEERVANVPYPEKGADAYVHGRNRAAFKVNELMRRMRAANRGRDPRDSAMLPLEVDGDGRLVQMDVPGREQREVLDKVTGEPLDPLLQTSMRAVENLGKHAKALEKKYGDGVTAYFEQRNRKLDELFGEINSGAKIPYARRQELWARIKPIQQELRIAKSDAMFLTEYAQEVVDAASKVLPARWVDREVAKSTLVVELLRNRVNDEMGSIAKQMFKGGSGGLVQVGAGKAPAVMENLRLFNEAAQKLRLNPKEVFDPPRLVEMVMLSKAGKVGKAGLGRNIIEAGPEAVAAKQAENMRIRGIMESGAERVKEEGRRYSINKGGAEELGDVGVHDSMQGQHDRVDPWAGRRAEFEGARGAEVAREQAAPGQDAGRVLPGWREAVESEPEQTRGPVYRDWMERIRRAKGMAKMDAPVKGVAPLQTRKEIARSLPLLAETAKPAPSVRNGVRGVFEEPSPRMMGYLMDLGMKEGPTRGVDSMSRVGKLFDERELVPSEMRKAYTRPTKGGKQLRFNRPWVRDVSPVDVDLGVPVRAEKSVVGGFEPGSSLDPASPISPLTDLRRQWGWDQEARKRAGVEEEVSAIVRLLEEQRADEEMFPHLVG